MTRLQRARQFVNEPWAADWIGHDWWTWLLMYVYHYEHAIYASLALDGYPARGPCRLAVTNLYPGNTFKGWGRI